MLVIFVEYSYDIFRTCFGAYFFWFLANVLATSVIMSVTGAAPFNGTSDQNLSVAYISAFILVFLVNFFFFYAPLQPEEIYFIYIYSK